MKQYQALFRSMTRSSLRDPTSLFFTYLFPIILLVVLGRLVEVLPDHDFGRLGIHAVYPHRRHLSAKVQAFVQHLLQVLPAQV